MLFGLACEGVTDLITLENILCGYFENAELDEEIVYVQPHVDETDHIQKDFGGWQMLFDYLGSNYFRDAVLNYGYLVIQVDTDHSCDKGFDVPQTDEDNKPLLTEVLVKNVIARLIAIVNSGETGFYQQHSEKIIFCISVHSLECWLYAHYNTKPLKKPKVTGCHKALSYIKPTIEKNYRCYDKLSQVFLKRKNIDAVAQKDASFDIFIQALATIENQITL